MPDPNITKQLNPWRQQEAITAARLNQMVDAINSLLKIVGYLHNRTALACYAQSDPDYPRNPGIIEKVTIHPNATVPFISYGHLILPPSSGLSAALWDPSVTSPVINDATLHLNLAANNLPGAISAVTISPDSTTPSISSGVLDLPAANYDPSDPTIGNPGAIVSAEITEYDPSDPSSIYKKKPTISAGHLTIPIPASIQKIVNVTADYGYSAAPDSDGWTLALFLNGTYQSGALEYVRNDRILVRIRDNQLQIVNQEQLPDSSSPSWHPSPYI